MPNNSSPEKITIMDVSFSNLTKEDLLNHHLFPRLNRKQKSFIVTANPEIVMKTCEDATYKNMVEQADYVIPDGAGIIMASNYMKQPIKERVAGYELMLDLLEFGDIQGMSCYFLGAKDHVVEKTVLEVEKRFPNLKIAGYQDGYFSDNESELVSEKVAATKPDMIFVALGSPRQEEWITRHMGDFSKGLFMGVGGSFDVLAGEVKRAPRKWIDLNLEWLYRILKQPSRVKRIFKVFVFMGKVVFGKGR